MLHDRIEALLDAMTVDEQITLLAGRDFWTTAPIERLGVPAIKVSDGPNGARGGGAFVGGVTRGGVSRRDLAVRRVGTSRWSARSAPRWRTKRSSKGARVLLAPTVNMHRSTLNGRNFECYSEDPRLASEIAVAYIDGLAEPQASAATVKHFIGNESEYQRAYDQLRHRRARAARNLHAALRGRREARGQPGR